VGKNGKEAGDRMKFIATFTGQHIDYSDVRPEHIVIEDIAVALSHLCRFAGHVPEFYSVAQHGVLCSQLTPPEFALEALLHDAAEAYCLDLPSPLKRLLPAYKEIEGRLDNAIRQRFDLPLTPSKVIKQVDLMMLATERRDLNLDPGSDWPMLAGISPTTRLTVTPLMPREARALFLSRFQELTTG
jgi:hypothetical protein